MIRESFACRILDLMSYLNTEKNNLEKNNDSMNIQGKGKVQKELYGTNSYKIAL